MAKVEYRKLRQGEYERLERELKEGFSSMRHADLLQFLDDMLTPSEVVMFSRRLRIAKELLTGKSHREIEATLHTGLITIQAVDRWLCRDCKNYRQTFSRLYEEEKKRDKRERRKRMPVESHSFRDLRRRYPMHFLLFNLLLDDLP